MCIYNIFSPTKQNTLIITRILWYILLVLIVYGYLVCVMLCLGEGDAEVAIMFSFQNGDGGTNDASGGNIHLPFKSDTTPSTTTSNTTSTPTEGVEWVYKGSVLGVGQSHIFQTPVIRNLLTTGNPPVPNVSTLHTDERRNTTTASTNPIIPPEEGRDTFSPTNGTTTTDLGRPTTTDLSTPHGATEYTTQASGREASFGRASIRESRGTTSFFGRKRESTVGDQRNADGTSTRVLSSNSKGQRIKQVYYDEESFAIATMTSSPHTGTRTIAYTVLLIYVTIWRVLTARCLYTHAFIHMHIYPYYSLLPPLYNRW